MPIYFFNTYSSSIFRDLDGVELSGIDEARLVGIRHAGEILQDEGEKIVLDEDWRLEVLDEAGKTVFEFQAHLHMPATNAAGHN